MGESLGRDARRRLPESLYITDIIGEGDGGRCYDWAVRRAIVAALLAVVSVGVFALPAASDSSDNKTTLSFDFSDNDAPAAVSNGQFNIIIDVLPEHTGGFVRMVAFAPQNAGLDNLVCRYQAVARDSSTVECGFNFTASGTWAIKAQYATTKTADVSAVAVTNILVGS